MNSSKRWSGASANAHSYLRDFPTDPELANRVHYVHLLLDNSTSMGPHVGATCEALNMFRDVLMVRVL